MTRNEIIQDVFEVEIQAIEGLKERVGKSFDQAIEFIKNSEGKVIVTGMGKSGIIGQKFSATLSSTGTPSFFIHPAESSHGDLGMISEKDTVVAISYGGGSNELDAVINYVKRNGINFIVLTGNTSSKLAKAADSVLDVSVSREACPLNLAPTASTTATLAMCDALAMVLLHERGFKEEDFAQFHPGGSLGRKLLTRVKDVIPEDSRLPLVQKAELAKNVIDVMTNREVRGICGVVDEQGHLVGSVTDGDVRRWLKNCFESEKTEEIRSSFNKTTAQDLMSTNPKVISDEELASKALYLMDQFSISSLFVVKKQESLKATGIIHIQDLLEAQIK